MLSMPSIGIRQLLAEAFGPYPDNELLSDVFRKGTILNLMSLNMECNSAPIGFDESEFIGPPPTGHRTIYHAIIFYGVLEIESLDWLSAQGKKWLESDLRRRASMIAEINLQHVNGLCLTRLFGDARKRQLRIRVWIQGEKNMLARFLTGGQPESLILQSKRRSDPRCYTFNVVSLDAGVLERSRNFMQRYYLWALIDDIIKDNPRTSLKDRTIDWLVDNYLKRPRQQERYRQVILDTTSNADVDREGMTTNPRHLRHISRSDIFGVFGAHADWLLAQHLASNTSSVQKLNVRKLYAFCQQVKLARRASIYHNTRWGFPYGVEDDYTAGLDLSRFGYNSEFWDKRIKTMLKQKPKSKTKRTVKLAARENPVNRQPPTTFVYDSDFSEPSTASASDSDHDEYVTESTPSFCFFSPKIPAGRFEWTCPGCEYRIDLLEMARRGLIGGEAEWRYRDEESVYLFFTKMVSKHYSENHVHIERKEKIQAIKVEGVD